MTAPKTERDLDLFPYTGDELRVVEYLKKVCPDIGAGPDPIGFLIVSYGYAVQQRNMAQKRTKEVQKELVDVTKLLNKSIAAEKARGDAAA
jgi:hypothetical protein